MRKVIKVIIIVIIIFIFLDLCKNSYNEKKINLYEKNYNIDSNVQNIEIGETKKIQWSEQVKGYEIIGKLAIPKIGLQTNVLEECNNKSLLVSVAKFWGGQPNEIGNFCIAGHNYKRKNMFSNINQLENGDEVLLTDKYNITVTYVVYSVEKVLPENISCIDQETNGKREITLITCTSDSKKRIIVKALEKSFNMYSGELK